MYCRPPWAASRISLSQVEPSSIQRRDALRIATGISVEDRSALLLGRIDGHGARCVRWRQTRWAVSSGTGSPGDRAPLVGSAEAGDGRSRIPLSRLDGV